MSHTIIVPLTASPNIDGTPLTDGDHVGVFYDSTGTMACAGYEVWTGSANIAVAAFGDDAASTEKDGFATGEVLKWKVWRHADGLIADVAASYIPPGGLGGILTDTSAYATNEISGISSLSGTLVGVSQTGLPTEFSLSQNYPQPLQPFHDHPLRSPEPFPRDAHRLQHPWPAGGDARPGRTTGRLSRGSL